MGGDVHNLYTSIFSFSIRDLEPIPHRHQGQLYIADIFEFWQFFFSRSYELCLLSKGRWVLEL